MKKIAISLAITLCISINLETHAGYWLCPDDTTHYPSRNDAQCDNPIHQNDSTDDEPDVVETEYVETSGGLFGGGGILGTGIGRSHETVVREYRKPQQNNNAPRSPRKVSTQRSKR